MYRTSVPTTWYGRSGDSFSLGVPNSLTTHSIKKFVEVIGEYLVIG
jgi:hypothetical protein